MNLFRSFQLAASAPVARERLQILLEYERKLGSQIDLFTVLREEILAVVSRHVVDPEKVQVTVDRGAKFSTLGVNIEIPNTGGKARTLPTDCPVLHRDKTVGMRGLRVNKGQMMRGVDAAAGTLAVPIWLAGATVGAILLAAKGRRHRADHLAVPRRPDRGRGPRRLALCAAARRQRTPRSR